MHAARLIGMLVLFALLAGEAAAQFSPRSDYLWARDVSVASAPAITLDGILDEPVWAQAESLAITYGVIDGSSGSGWKVMNGSGIPRDSARAVVKVLANRLTNTLYVAVVAADSSVGGSGWENSDGILAGIYDRTRRASNQVTLHRDIFISWVDSTGVGTLPNLTGGALPNQGVVTAAAHVRGLSNSDTDGLGNRVADEGWTIEFAVALDSIGYQANSPTTEEVQLSMCIWDMDWLNTNDHVATRAWWCNEWGNNGGSTAARFLLRSDVTVGSGPLPEYPADVIVPNGVNYPSITLDGALDEEVWGLVPSFDIQYGNTALRAAYPTIGKDRSGQWVSTPGVNPFNAGVATIRAVFQGDFLYIAADINDRSLNSYGGDDLMDGLQVSMTIPIDTLRDENAHIMVGRRFGFAVNATGGSLAVWDATEWIPTGAVAYALASKGTSTIDNNTDVDQGYTMEVSFDLTKFGYPAGAQNKTVAIGLTYHDYDKTSVDASGYRVWWFREWPGSSSPAFCMLDDASIVVSVVDDPTAQTARDFGLIGSYPNPFNPSTTIRFVAPAAGTARLLVSDVLGRLVHEQSLIVRAPGMQEHQFNAGRLASGVYYYRLGFTPDGSGSMQLSGAKSMVLLK
jgi:hypothetical protein